MPPDSDVIVPVIKSPSLPEEMPPENEVKKESDGQSGFDIIDFIVKTIIRRDPICFSFLLSYSKRFDLQNKSSVIYYTFLIICFLIDILYAACTVFLILLVLTIIIFSFARGVGVIDWLTEIMKLNVPI